MNKLKRTQDSPYTVEVQAFEIEKVNLSEVPDSRANHTTNWGNASDRFTTGAKLLNGVEKPYLIIVNFLIVYSLFLQ